MKVLSSIAHLISFQTCKTFVHLQNTNKDIFIKFRELSDPDTDNYSTNVQGPEGNKDIIK